MKLRIKPNPRLLSGKLELWRLRNIPGSRSNAPQKKCINNHALTLHPVLCIDAPGIMTRYRSFLPPSFSFILRLASLSHPLPMVWWPSVTASYSGSPSMSALSRRALISHPPLPFHPASMTCPASPFSSDDLLTRNQERWPDQLAKHREVPDYLWDPRGQGWFRSGEGGLAQPSGQLALLAVSHCQPSIMYGSAVRTYLEGTRVRRVKTPRGQLAFLYHFSSRHKKVAWWTTVNKAILFLQRQLPQSPFPLTLCCLDTCLICYLSMDDCIFRKNCSEKTTEDTKEWTRVAEFQASVITSGRNIFSWLRTSQQVWKQTA